MFHRALILSSCVLSAGSLAHAQTTYYWDGNDDTANNDNLNFGTNTTGARREAWRESQKFP